MKILKQFESIHDAEALSERLESKGILTHISSGFSSSLSAGQTGAVRVVLVHQYDDAVAYLKNKKHVISTELSKEEIDQLKNKSSNEFHDAINKFIVVSFLCIAVVIFLMYFLIVT